MPKKKIWASFQRIVKVFTPKFFNMLSNIWVWDPGSEIRDLEKTYSGSRIQGSKRHRLPDPDPQHCFLGALKVVGNEKLGGSLGFFKGAQASLDSHDFYSIKPFWVGDFGAKKI
jgi:hypothetical protein